MPPSGSVEVSVAVTSFEEREELPAVVPDVGFGVLSDVWVVRVVSSLVEEAVEMRQWCYSSTSFFAWFRISSTTRPPT